MVRTVLLVVASVASILVGYAAYTYQEGGLRLTGASASSAPTSRPMGDFEGAGLVVRGGTVRAGAKPYVVVYDAEGEPKYQFRAVKWEPVSETEFKLVQPEVCVFMPGGQMTQVRADDGQIFVERAGGNNINPKRGYLHGHVMIFIDRTDRNWRRSKPDQAAPDLHPEHVIHIWLDEIRFDLDQSWIKSPGTLRVQSAEAEIEGRGLTLAWNERDNRIERLDIEQGKRMELRRGGNMVSFGMPGQERDASDRVPAGPVAESEREKTKQELKQAGAMVAVGVGTSRKTQTPSAFIERALLQGASANKSLSIDKVYPEKKPATRAVGRRTAQFSDKPASPRKRITLFGKDDKDGTTNRKPRQIDTYHAVFEGDVVVEQRRGPKTLGQLSGADRLELVFDVGESQRKAARGDVPTTQPASDKSGAPSEPPDAGPQAMAAASTSRPTSQPEDQTRIILLWTGRLSLKPVEVPQAEQTGKRFDAIATGKEVRLTDRQGEVVCRRLYFRNETEQAWLYGSTDHPVRMWSGETRRLLGNEIYVDRKTGIAVVNGPGTMSDARESLASVAIPGSDESQPIVSSKPSQNERIEVSWTQQVELDFDLGEVKRIDPTTGQEETKRREYVKQASFRGRVRMKQGDQSIAADEVVMSMDVPKDVRGLVGPIRGVRAAGDVTLMQQKDEIHCDKLSVSMVDDEAGRNVPKSATAYGNVTARQDQRSIRARDLLSVIIGPVQVNPASTQTAESAKEGTIDPVQLARVKELALLRGIRPAEIDALLREKGLAPEAMKAFAAAKGIDPDMVLKLIKPKKPKSRLAIIEMHAFGDVVAVDPVQKLDVQTEELHCSLPDGKKIDRATLIAKPNEKARSEFGDYVINGHRIEIDMPREFAEVPDEGWLRFASRQSLDGRELDEPVPTEVRWSKHMRLEGRRNIGEFVGDVKASNQTSELKCDRLQIDFVDLPPEEIERQKKEAPSSRWQVLERLWSDKSKTKSRSTPDSFRQSFNKKPVLVAADGDVVVLSSIFDKENVKRLLSRMRIAGPKLTVDLRKEQMDVVGNGSLLIEDYRLPAGRDDAIRQASSGAKDPLMANFAGRGPSQTAFTWANSMTYYVGQNLAVLDRSVSMVHMGGSSMARGEDLAKAMSLDISKLRMKGREAALTCDNLTVEFLRSDRKGKGGTTFDRAGAAELKRLVAKGNIYLEDGGRSLVGEELTYNRDSNEIVVRGTAENHARLFQQDTKTGQLQGLTVAPMIRWDRNAGVIDAPGARIIKQ